MMHTPSSLGRLSLQRREITVQCLGVTRPVSAPTPISRTYDATTGEPTSTLYAMPRGYTGQLATRAQIEAMLAGTSFPQGITL